MFPENCGRDGRPIVSKERKKGTKADGALHVLMPFKQRSEEKRQGEGRLGQKEGHPLKRTSLAQATEKIDMKKARRDQEAKFGSLSTEDKEVG